VGTILTAAAYVLVAGFFVTERWVRDDRTKDMGRATTDRGTTAAISVTMGTGFVLLAAAPLLNWLGVGPMAVWWLASVGLVCQAMGLTVRVFALRTLGRFFTRTLQHVEDQQLVTSGIYRHIRHPGYLSDLLLFVGAGLAVHNAVVITVITVSFVGTYAYRIVTEERMLTTIFGSQYTEYQATSWRLIPFVV